VEVSIARIDMLDAAWRARDAANVAALDLIAQREQAALSERMRVARTVAVDAARALVAAGVTDSFEWQTLALESNAARLDQLNLVIAGTAAAADLAAALGYKYDHTLSVIRELARAQIVALPRGAFSLREHTISIIDGSPWVGVVKRTGGAAPVATSAPEFDAGDQTPVVEAPPEVEEDPTVESKTKKAPKARKGETL
jgi:hypothetical protein